MTTDTDLEAVADPQVVRLMHAAVGVRDAAVREQRRRLQAASFRSLVMDPGHVFSGLMRPAPYKIFWGGRDAAKSWAFAEALIRKTNDRTLRVLCTREYQNSIKDSVHQTLVDMIDRLGLGHRFHSTQTSITHRHNGSAFIFKGLQKPAEIKSMEGIDIAWVAEAQNTSEESWETLEPTIRKEDSEIWVDFNMVSEDLPTYKRLVAAPGKEWIVHKVNYYDNPFLSSRSKEKIARLKERDYQAYLHIYEGMPKKFSDAQILGGKWEVHGFSDDLWVECIRRGGRLFYGLDFGFAHDPMALIRFFVLDEVLYIEHEAFGVGVDFEGDVQDGKGEMERFMESVPECRDWPIKADSSRPETISFLCGRAFQVSAAAKWEGCVEDGIAHLRGFKKIVIHTRCKEIAQEAVLWSYKVDKITKAVLPLVIDAHNHGWDAVRYGLDGYIQQRGGLDIWSRLGEGYQA